MEEPPNRQLSHLQVQMSYRDREGRGEKGYLRNTNKFIVPILTVNGAVRVPIPKTEDRVQQRFSRARRSRMRNPNRVGGTRLPPEKHHQHKNSRHPEPGPHNNQPPNRETEQEKPKSKGQRRVKIIGTEGQTHFDRQKRDRAALKAETEDFEGSEGGYHKNINTGGRELGQFQTIEKKWELQELRK